MQVSRAIVRSLVPRNAGLLSSIASYHHGNHKVTTMDDLPVPEGDWHEKYHHKQTKNNAILAGSVLLFLGVVGYIKQTGAVNFNWAPPATYE